MIRKNLTVFLLMLIALDCAKAGPVKPVDRIVAVVNKGVITKLELDHRVAQTIAGMKDKKVATPPADQLQSQVLERMITEEAQIQIAQTQGIKISDSEVDTAIEHIAKQNKVGVDAIYAKAKQEGITQEDFRTQIRREIMIDQLRKREVDSRIVVTDTEVAQALKSGDAKSKVEYHLAAILVALPENADDKIIATREARAKQAMEELNAGKSFTQVSVAYSDAPTAAQGGDAGWRQASSLPPELAKTLENTKVGGYSEPLRTQQGFYIFKVIERRAQGEAQMVEQYHVEHILVKTNETVSESEAKAKIDQIKLDISRGKNFEEAAKQSSEDASASLGGDLGWISPGDTVPEFENALKNLPLNTVSEPVRSPFGWHLIKVVEKRQQDVSADREANAAKQQIRLRKSETEYVNWVRQLRDSMFIQNRLKEE